MHSYAPDTSDIVTRPADTRIVVAMSGGVDSSVVAAMLKEQGYDVVGITLQLYDYGQAVKPGSKTCCAGRDIHDAKRVAENINIPHYVLNYESKFKNSVMEDFADTYLAGATPIPCVRCNQTVKFRDLLETARELGATFMATGHYVQRYDGENGAEMHRAADPIRDQSYFLFTTTQEQLDFLRFPLGHLKNKDETRALAAKYGLQVADKPDSQDICFVPDGNYARIVERLRPGAADPGKIMHVNGTEVGEHRGIIHYTVGQRKGLGIAWPEPLYVIRLDAQNKQVIVGPKEALETRCFRITNTNWLVTDIEARDSVTVKLRSTHAGTPATIRLMEEGTAEVTLLDTDSAGAVSPGQACVAYAGERMLGGGWIATGRDNMQ